MAFAQKLLTKPEAAEIVRVTPRSLDKYVAAGTGPAPTRIGGRILFRADVLEEWIRYRTDMPPTT